MRKSDMMIPNYKNAKYYHSVVKSSNYQFPRPPPRKKNKQELFKICCVIRCTNFKSLMQKSPNAGSDS